MQLTVTEIKKRLANVNAEEFSKLEQQFASDSRKSVQAALNSCRRRLANEAAEAARTEAMYAFERKLCAGGLVVGLDEVGRGPLAGPLAVGAVVLPQSPVVLGLNDSKQLSAKTRESLAEQVKCAALAWHVEYVQPAVIDECGISWALKHAFKAAIAKIDSLCGAGKPSAVLIDGNALHIDSREINVVKGDAKCASIAAASIVAKVARDGLMCEYAKDYPQYHFESNKGYGAASHIAAIKQFGLSPLHRASFCKNF